MSNLLDSGERRQFDSGAVRDINIGKGRCDLVPLEVVSYFAPEEYSRIFKEIGRFVYDLTGEHIIQAISDFIKIRGWDFSTMLLEVSIHYEDGANKYAERNWEKGLPIQCFIDSGVRHLAKFIRGDEDERHDRAFIWNMLGALWTLDNVHESVTSDDSTTTLIESLSPESIYTDMK